MKDLTQWKSEEKRKQLVFAPTEIEYDLSDNVLCRFSAEASESRVAGVISGRSYRHVGPRRGGGGERGGRGEGGVGGRGGVEGSIGDGFSDGLGDGSSDGLGDGLGQGLSERVGDRFKVGLQISGAVLSNSSYQ